MGTLIQRRPFDHADFAHATAAGLRDPDFNILGITIATNVVEQEGRYWLVVTQHGDTVNRGRPLLPEYELVAFLD